MGDVREAAVLAAIEELERDEVKPKWWEAPERAFRRGARMEVAPPPLELQREVAGHGVFPDALPTRYDWWDYEYRAPSCRSAASAPEEDDVRRMREWSEHVLRLSMKLREHVYRETEVVLLPREYPALEAAFGMRVHHVAIRGGYVGYQFDADEAGMAKAMGTYWTLERARGEPWIVAGRELLHRMARSDRVFCEPVRVSLRETSATAPTIMPRRFSELGGMRRVLDLPSSPGIFVGYSMILPLITDMEQELRRTRDRYA